MVRKTTEHDWHPVLWPYQIMGFQPTARPSKNNTGIELVAKCDYCFREYARLHTATKHSWTCHRKHRT